MCLNLVREKSFVSKIEKLNIGCTSNEAPGDLRVKLAKTQ